MTPTDEHNDAIETQQMNASQSKSLINHPVITASLGAIIASIFLGVGASGAMLWRSAPVVDKEIDTIEKNIEANKRSIDKLSLTIERQQKSFDASIKSQNTFFVNQLNVQAQEIAKHKSKIESQEKSLKRIEQWYSRTNATVSGLSNQLARIEGAINHSGLSTRPTKRGRP